jgi:chitin disaccharide deacetylase
MSGALVVNADDLGVSKGATLGILRAHREGIVTSASLCVTTPFYRHAVETCVRQCPELGVGLHFSLTAGTPASEREQVPLLVDARGRFRWRFGSLFVALMVQRREDLLAQIRHEVQAQFARLASDGIRADHVDGERHVHLIPGIFECVADTARRYDVRFVRAGHDRGPDLLRARDIPALAATGGFTKYALLSRLAERARTQLGAGLSSADHVVSYLYTGRMDVVLPDLLKREPTGITEVMLHPGVPEENGALDLGNPAMERYLMSRHRRLELDASIAARTQKTAWRLTNYRTLAGQLA